MIYTGCPDLSVRKLRIIPVPYTICGAVASSRRDSEVVGTADTSDRRWGSGRSGSGRQGGARELEIQVQSGRSSSCLTRRTPYSLTVDNNPNFKLSKRYNSLILWNRMDWNEVSLFLYLSILWNLMNFFGNLFKNFKRNWVPKFAYYTSILQLDFYYYYYYLYKIFKFIVKVCSVIVPFCSAKY